MPAILPRVPARPWRRALALGALLAAGLPACQREETTTSEPVSPSSPASSNPSEPTPPDPAGLETATLGAGCFWCVEAIYQRLAGVVSVESGYAGGTVANPSYERVCSGDTGHAEVCRIRYDPAKVSYSDLLKVFFSVHDPTTLNRQGADVGSQYRSVIFYHTPEQQQTAERIQRELDAAGVYDRPIVTQIVPAAMFYPAEDYHQNYFNDNPRQPYCRMVVAPKVEKFEKIFRDELKSTASGH